MIKKPAIPTPIDPQLIDLALLEIQSILVAKLSWLDSAFGKAQLIVSKKGTKDTKVPNVYIGGKDYLPVLPDSHIGNFTFFDFPSEQKIIQNGRVIEKYRTPMGLIVWYDFRTVYPNDWEDRTIEHVKKAVVDVVSKMTLLKSRVTILSIQEKAAEIYRGYTNTEIDNQYLMRPFGGFRLNLDFEYWHENNC